MADTEARSVAHFGHRECRWSVASDDHRMVELAAELYFPLLTEAPGTARDPDGAPTAGDGARLPPAVAYVLQPPTGDALGELRRDGKRIRRGGSPARLLEALVWSINQQVIGAEPDATRLHAAGASDDAGRVVALPAPMEAGKTTLVTSLLDHGLAYLSDEALLIDGDLHVAGYAKPLSIDRGSWELLAHHRPQLEHEMMPFMAQQWLVPPHRFTDIRRSGRLAAMVFPRYEPDAATSLTLLGGADALELAMAATFHLDGGPLPVARVRELAEIVTGVPTYRLVSGRLDEATTRVLEVLASAPEVLESNSQP